MWEEEVAPRSSLWSMCITYGWWFWERWIVYARRRGAMLFLGVSGGVGGNVPSPRCGRGKGFDGRVGLLGLFDPLGTFGPLGLFGPFGPFEPFTLDAIARNLTCVYERLIVLYFTVKGRKIWASRLFLLCYGPTKRS